MNNEKIIWTGAAGIVMVQNKILMVREKATKNWSVPSGEIEKGETPEQACAREVWEETGFKVKIANSIRIKREIVENYDVTTYYFKCEITDGELSYADPDEEIEEISWKTYEDLLAIQHDYPEDLEMLLSFFEESN
ncbi:8-oxo-dGTP pyrophosphatase MutT (NUDIX family) [Planomicrobium stackebrandtii]|uniref:8-oxo-dGTP pyrophosphatase MutT (NUDIX family) n=1 Tax=Planomicrobium stackebrandtii TaxID=253160 RepID=A0ABU0GQG8_9BACL|nr:NUDIX hydrolase [Planomicrobium stackebrandtii]MDQ0427528.1 8-oxo-dGTP pyrophosphatase MutT (NUDIX family) [Planomicrobium stackebrandtii]